MARVSLRLIAGTTALSFGLLPMPLLVAPAHAIVGRPASPMSYAGVARRSTYRAAAYTTTAVAASSAAARQCYTRYDSYGRAVVTCY